MPYRGSGVGRWVTVGDADRALRALAAPSVAKAAAEGTSPAGAPKAAAAIMRLLLCFFASRRIAFTVAFGPVFRIRIGGVLAGEGAQEVAALLAHEESEPDDHDTEEYRYDRLGDRGDAEERKRGDKEPYEDDDTGFRHAYILAGPKNDHNLPAAGNDFFFKRGEKVRHGTTVCRFMHLRDLAEDCRRPVGHAPFKFFEQFPYPVWRLKEDDRALYLRHFIKERHAALFVRQKTKENERVGGEAARR